MRLAEQHEINVAVAFDRLFKGLSLERFQSCRCCLEANRVGYFSPFISPLSSPFDHPRLLPKRDELPRPTLHCLIICVLRGCEVPDQSNQLLDVLIGIVPGLDLEGQILLPIPH